MADDKPPAEPSPQMPPRNRFGYNEPPNAHISRDTPLVLETAIESSVELVAQRNVADSTEPKTEASPEAPSAPMPPSMGWLPGDDSTNQVVGDAVRRRGFAVAAMSDFAAPPFPLAASSKAQGSARSELTLTPEPVTIVPTPYPNDPAAPLVVHGAVHIDTRSAEFVEFNTKINTLIDLLTRSNEIAGDTRDQLLAEIKAGMSLLSAPNADPNCIKVFLERPLLWIAAAAGTGMIGGLAHDAVQLLYQVLGHAPAIPL